MSVLNVPQTPLYKNEPNPTSSPFNFANPRTSPVSPNIPSPPQTGNGHSIH